LAGVNGKIVKAIIELDRMLFLKRIINLGLLAIPASFVNSMLDFLNKRLAINFRRRLTNHFHEIYLKDMVYYQLSNLDSRIKNPDQRLTSDVEKWAQSLSMIYSNFSKPILDIYLFSRKLSELVGWIGPGVVVLWYFISGLFIKFISPPFGKLTAIEQKLEGVYRAAHTDLVHHSE
jgi:ATP-binding cassette subfamily D (ALD) protein 3